MPCHISGISGWAWHRGEESWRSVWQWELQQIMTSLKLPSLVFPGGKWLHFPWVGGIPMSETEPHWWHINGVPNNVTRTWLIQTKWFVLFLARAFAPILNDQIWSFSSQPLISCQWLPNQVTQGIECLELTPRWRAPKTCHPKVQRTYGSWKHWVILPPLAILVPSQEVTIQLP